MINKENNIDDQPSSTVINKDIKVLVQVLAKWIKLVNNSASLPFTPKTKNDQEESPTKDNDNYNEWYIFQLSEIGSLDNQIEQTLAKYYNKKEEDSNSFDNHGGQERPQLPFHKKFQKVRDLLNCFQMFVQKLKEDGVSRLLLSANNDCSTTKTIKNNNPTSSDNIDKLRQQQRLVIRLSLIYVHTKTVVGISNLLIVCSNTSATVIPTSESITSKVSTPQSTLNIQLPPPLLSTNEESLIRLSLCHSFRLSFTNILKRFFMTSSYENFEKIFPISGVNGGIFDHIFQKGDDITHDRISQDKHEVKWWDKDQHEEQYLMEPIYLIYVYILLMNEEVLEENKQMEEIIVIQQTLRKDCFAILLALFAIYSRLTTTNNDNGKPDSEINSFKNNLNNEWWTTTDQSILINQKFSESHFCGKNRPFVIRNLLLILTILSREKHKQLTYTIVNMFRNHLINHGGLELLIDSTLDSDYYSERETTIQHRLQAMTTMVINLPVKQKLPYLQKIVEQALNELLIKQTKFSHQQHSLEIYWRFGSMILSQLNQLNEKSVMKESCFDIISQSFRHTNAESPSNISLEDAVLILLRLVSFRSCLKKISQFFPEIFFLRFQFEQEKKITSIHHIPLKDQSEKLILEMLKEIPRSVYILDDCVCVQQEKWLYRFCIKIDDLGQEIRHKIQINDTIDQEYSENLDLERINCLVAFTLKLLDQMSIDFRFNFFYLLLEHLIDTNPPPIVLFLIGPFGDQLFGATISKREQDDRENFLLSSRRTVLFLNGTLERIVNRMVLIKPDYLTEDTTELKNNLKIWTETLSISLRILSILLDKIEINPEIKLNHSSIDSDDCNYPVTITILEELKPCQHALGILLQNSHTLKALNGIDERLAENIYSRFEKLYDRNSSIEISTIGDNNLEPLECALNNLRNNDFMPSKVHSLIIIKRLILARHPSISMKFDKVLLEVKKVLRDSESYLFLAAIKTIAALAIYHTNQALPILLEELITPTLDKQKCRPLSDCLKIGEVLLQLTLSIGDFAHHYSSQYIHGLLCGVKSQEPAIRVSCLSCLGEFCRRFRFGLAKHIVELILMAEHILTTDPDMDVRRSVVLFLHLLLKGVDRHSAILIEDHLKKIKNLILDVGNRTLDDVLQRHCSQAYAEISRIARELLQLE